MLSSDDGRERCWEITWEGPVVEIVESVDGVESEVLRQVLATPAEVADLVKREVDARLALGWTEHEAGPAGPVARDEALEAMIRADPEAVDPYLVYGDWLEAHGDPRGELVAMHHAGLAEAAERLLSSRAGYFFGELASVIEAVRIEWHLGFMRSARVAAPRDAGDPGHMTAVTVRRLLQNHSARFLRRLEVQRFDDNADYLQTIDAMIEVGLPPTLIELALGRLREGGAAMYCRLPRLLELFGRARELEHVALRGGFGLELRGLSLPNARRFELSTDQLQEGALSAVACASWPRLETLVLGFGHPIYSDGSACALADPLDPLLGASGAPRLRTLVLELPHSSDLLAALGRAPLFRQLETIDLSGGHVSDEEAEIILGGARWEAIRELVLPSRHALTDRVVAGLLARSNVRFADPERSFVDAYADSEEPEEDGIYPAVFEDLDDEDSGEWSGWGEDIYDWQPTRISYDEEDPEY